MCNVVSTDPMFGMRMNLVVPLKQWNKLPMIIHKSTTGRPAARCAASWEREEAQHQLQAALQYSSKPKRSFRNRYMTREDSNFGVAFVTDTVAS
jgi:hypothetical protein